jgi:hypothetical protein
MTLMVIAQKKAQKVATCATKKRKATRTVETQKLEIRPKKIISCSLILLLFKP